METIRILGLMSGTSLDGLDLALCEFRESEGTWTYDLLKTGFREYTPLTRKKLQDAIALDAPGLLALHSEYGAWLGDEAARFLRDSGLQAEAVASHGHTIHHQPEAGFSFQLGCPQRVALATGLKTIGDFRSLDVALGGQGAPLVPVGDRLLFGQYRFCLNLGGISNLSFEDGERRVAFDVGVANMLLNHLCAPLGLAYDRGGALARRGSLNRPLLEALDALPYYGKPYPKSTGFEAFRETVLPLLEQHPDKPENQLHTAVRHIAGQIARQFMEHSHPRGGSVLVTGGGAFNTYLLEVLEREAGPAFPLVVPDPELIAFKEALVFALLGALRLKGIPNVLASVTGARRDSCSGVVYLP